MKVRGFARLIRLDLQRLVPVGHSELFVVLVTSIEGGVEESDEGAFAQVSDVSDIDFLWTVIYVTLRMPQRISMTQREEMLSVDFVYRTGLGRHFKR